MWKQEQHAERGKLGIELMDGEKMKLLDEIQEYRTVAYSEILPRVPYAKPNLQMKFFIPHRFAVHNTTEFAVETACC